MIRRENDNKKQKIRYWRNKYNYDLSMDDYDRFNQISNIIRYIYKYHDFIIKYDPVSNQEYSKEDLEIYVKNHKYFKKAIPYLDYIKSLKKIKNENDENIKEPITITF